jgi:fatty acid desaturase
MESAHPRRWNRRRRLYAQDTLTILACLAALVAMYAGAGWLADHTPQVIAGLVVLACIGLLGLLVGAMIAGPKS